MRSRAFATLLRQLENLGSRPGGANRHFVAGRSALSKAHSHERLLPVIDREFYHILSDGSLKGVPCLFSPSLQLTFLVPNSQTDAHVA